MYTQITYRKKWVYTRGKYKCECGHRFYRENNDWFTISEFNLIPNGSAYETECAVRAEYQERLKNRIRKCPKCKKECKPIK